MKARDMPLARAPAEVVSVLPAAMKRLRREHFYVVALNPRNQVLGVRCVARGFVDSCPVDPREIFGFAISKRATAIVVAHNHPSGSAEPSPLDIQLTRQLVEGGRILGVRVLDHLIVARGGEFVSMATRGDVGFK